MKNIKKNTIILLAITIIVLFIVLKDNFILVLNNITNINHFWLSVSVVFIVIYWLFQALSLYTITKEYSKKIKFKNIYKQTLITQFFNGVTPFSTGGQPISIYMLTKSKIKATHATNIVLQNFILYQSALISVGTIALLINWRLNLFVDVPILKSFIVLGFLINIFVGIALLFVCFSTKFNKKVIFNTIDILGKIKLIKNINQKKLRWERRINEFHNSALLLKERKEIFIKGYVYNLLSLISMYIIPLFILFSLNDFNNLNIVNTIVTSAYVLIMGAFVPIPGGSGGIEYGYMQLFGNFISGHILSTSLLLWRFITYYLGILIGGIVLNLSKGGNKK